MFLIIFIILAGIALYFLLKPPTESEYEQALRVEPISKPGSEVKKQRNDSGMRNLGKVF